MDALLRNALGRDASELLAEERQRLLSRLLSRLAHEIRNPLSSLDVHVQLLEEDLERVSPPVSPDITSRLEIIHSELKRLDAIVRQFLSLAAPAPVHLQPLAMAEVVQHVTRLLGPVAAERGIELASRLPDDLPSLHADAGQLKQALINLVLNAIQAVERRGRVEVSAHCDEPRGLLAIEVCDSGPGIDPERRLAIFEPFFTTKPEGSGLGLWIVQQIAMAHGGSIAAANSDRGGARFTLHLPLASAPLPS
jgi:signal transduction histidine kinase